MNDIVLWPHIDLLTLFLAIESFIPSCVGLPLGAMNKIAVSNNDSYFNVTRRKNKLIGALKPYESLSERELEDYDIMKKCIIVL